MVNKVKILSWDVGIKNLAYCIIECDNIQKKFKIIKWDNINILDTNKFVCCNKLNNNNICGKVARYYGPTTDGIKLYYCGLHKNKYNPFNKKEEFLEKIDDDFKCTYKYPKKKITCNKKAYYKCKENNNYYCKNHGKNYITKNNNFYKIKLIPKQIKSTKIDPEILSLKMYSKLDAINDLLDIDIVLIENQPSLTNPTMKLIASFLFSYFVIKGLNNKENSRINNVKFISPSNKLKMNKEVNDKIIKSIDINSRIYRIIGKIINDTNNIAICYTLRYIIDKNTNYTKPKELNNIDLKKVIKNNKSRIYNIIKLLGIEYTKILLDQDKEWLDYLNKYKKKDDMCDSFLQGYFFISL